MKIQKIISENVVDLRPPEDRATPQEEQAALATISSLTETAAGKAFERALDSAEDRFEDAEDSGVEDFGNISNVMLIGEAGVAKTAIAKAWAKAHDLNLYIVSAASLDPLDLGGLAYPDEPDPETHKRNTASQLHNTKFDPLSNKKTVLFLDELNRAAGRSIDVLLTLINDHMIENQRYLFAFTIAAINPDYSKGRYKVNELDWAQKGRFAKVIIDPNDPKNLKSLFDVALIPKYNRRLEIIKKKIAELKTNANGIDTNSPEYKNALGRLQDRANVAQWRLNTVKAFRQDMLSSHPTFTFDTTEELNDLVTSTTDPLKKEALGALNNRTFESIIDMSNGTMDGFLYAWDLYGNPNKKLAARLIAQKVPEKPTKPNQFFAAGNPPEPDPNDGGQGKDTNKDGDNDNTKEQMPDGLSPVEKVKWLRNHKK